MIGIVGVLLAILFWKDEIRYNQWNPQKENVYQAVHDIGEGVWSSGTIPEGPKMKEKFPEVQDYLYLNWMRNVLVVNEGKSTYLEGLVSANSNFFEFFPFPFVEGSSKLALSDLQSIVISKSWANQLFGNEPALGKSLKFEDKNYIVKGVYNNEFPSSESPGAIIPLNWNKIWEEQNTYWGNYQYKLYIKLNPQSYSEELMKKINHELFYVNQALPYSKSEGISVNQYFEKYGKTQLYLDRLSDMRLHSKGDGGTMGKGNLMLLYILTGLSIVILILSCFNFINLTTANALKRAKEVGIRKAIGAKQGNIMLQFMFESFLIAFCAFLLAMALLEIILPYYNDYLNKHMNLQWEKMIGYFLVVLVLVVIFSGSFPALYLSKFQPLNVLKGNFSRSKSGVWLRNFLMSFQFFISSFFLVGGIIVYLQVQYMINRDLGFSADQSVVVYFNNYQDTTRYEQYELMKQTFRSIEGVVDITSGMRVPGNASNSSSNLNYLDQNSVQATNNAMDFNYLDFLNIRIMDGRNLNPQIASDTIENILVNETLVKSLNLNDPINKFVESGMTDKKLKIVGVVSDYFIEGFEREIRPTIFYHWKTLADQRQYISSVLIKLDGGKVTSALQELETRWKKEIELGYPFNYAFVDQQFAKTYQQYEKQKDIFFILTVVVVMIALLGLFGLISFIIQQRMREISIRKVLGASNGSIVQMFSKKYVILSGLAVLSSIPLSYFLLQKWLENFVYKIEMPWWPYGVSALVLVALTFVVVALRAVRATKSNPIDYLKYE